MTNFQLKEKMLADALVHYCSPTLARLKIGGMVSLPLLDEEAFQKEIRELNQQLRPKGLEIIRLWQQKGKVLVYLYRVEHLELMLADERVRIFLAREGYTDFSLSGALATLKEHMALKKGFPHEIGVFLGYPLGDVIGFIENAGRNCVCCGCWKAYTNECDALRTFARLRKCRAIYRQRFADGVSLDRLTVRTRYA